MTLGGRIAVPEAKLQDLRSLIAAVTGLDADYPEDAQVPCPEEYNPAAKENFVEIPMLLSGYLYYFDIASKSSLPEIKLYTPIRRYGPDDRTLAQGITQWMASHGRSQYCASFQEMLEGLARHRRLEEGKGMQTYVSCLFKENGDLDVTSYIGPEAFDPNRLGRPFTPSPRRSTRRRSESR